LVIRISDVRHERGDYASLDDRMLVLDFQAGHPEAFVEVHNRYGNLARHVCRRLLANAHDTDEAFQETMIRVFQGLYRFNGRYALQPWISRIATNVSLDMIRSKTRRPVDERAVEEHDHEVFVDGPEESFDRLVERDLVLSVLSDLPDSHRRALILRELEGRSHREIGDAMGISPSQAKALIHRAKGSFRRRWMEKAADRSGLAGIALLPLLWLIRLADTARRVADRAGHAAQVAQAAVPDVASAASSTIVSASGAGFGERVLAAGMTLLVAGGVTVGAATIAKDRGNEEPAVRVQVAAPVADVPAPEPKVGDLQPRLDQVPPKEAQGPPEVSEEPVLVEPSPEEETPTESPPPESTPEPSPEPTEPSPEPSPEPVLPPAWTGSFGIGWTSEDLCGCGPGVELVSTTSDGGLLLPEGAVRIVQKIRGAASDAEGDAAWAVSGEILFDLRQAGGDVSVWFTLERDGVKTRFVATGFATEITGDLAAGEPVSYTFAGEYSIVGARPETSPIQSSGALSARVVVWSDGSTPVLTQVSLIP
jgi:RNA polymerase sigma-70 factor, ECF subfamily